MSLVRAVTGSGVQGFRGLLMVLRMVKTSIGEETRGHCKNYALPPLPKVKRAGTPPPRQFGDTAAIHVLFLLPLCSRPHQRICPGLFHALVFM